MGADMSKSFVGSQCTAPQYERYEVNRDGQDTEALRSDASTEEVFFTPTSTSDSNSGSLTSNFTSTAHTVIVFDWDDTLLCSTAVNSQRFTQKQLRELETAVESILLTAMELGETWIVTNGNATWVQDSAKRYLPNLLPLLDRLKVISARARCEYRYPGDPYMWKQVAFEELLVDERDYSDESTLNLIALGDQNPEIEAAHHVIRKMPTLSCVKTVKFKEAPTVGELVGQLAHVEAELQSIVSDEQTAYRSMTKLQVHAHQRHLVTLPTSWKLTPSATKADSPWSIRGAIAMKEIWPLFA